MKNDCNKDGWTSAFVQSSSAASLESVSTSLDSNTTTKVLHMQAVTLNMHVRAKQGPIHFATMTGMKKGKEHAQNPLLIAKK